MNDTPPRTPLESGSSSLPLPWSVVVVAADVAAVTTRPRKWRDNRGRGLEVDLGTLGLVQLEVLIYWDI